MYITTSIAIGSLISVSRSLIDESGPIIPERREEAKTKYIKT